MEELNLKELAKKYYDFILKYDKCIEKYKKPKSNLLNVEQLFNDMLEEHTKPYKSLTKGREVDELEHILSSDLETLHKHLNMYDFLQDDYYDLEKEVKEKKNLLKDFKPIYEQLVQAHKNIKENMEEYE